LTPETASPASAHDVLVRYRELLAEHQRTHDKIAASRAMLLSVLAGIAILIAYLSAMSMHLAVAGQLRRGSRDHMGFSESAVEAGAAAASA
jgi:hypothetical protein